MLDSLDRLRSEPAESVPKPALQVHPRQVMMPLRSRISDDDLLFVGLSPKRIDALRYSDDEVRQDVYEWEMRDLMSAPSGR